MTGFACKCGSEEFLPEYKIDELYVCSKCGRVVAYYCTGCNRPFMSNRLGLHGDVYECKLCGHIQWGYTEYKRKNK